VSIVNSKARNARAQPSFGVDIAGRGTPRSGNLKLRCDAARARPTRTDQPDVTARNHALRLGASGRGEVSPSGRVDSRYAKVLLNGGRGARTDETEAFARLRSPARVSSSYGNLASNSASEIPNTAAVALFGAPNAIIARTKRRSASPKFERPHSSAASASLSASTRGVMAFGFRPEPGLAPPRPTPLDFVISNPLTLAPTDPRRPPQWAKAYAYA
jgi:hypothetical protein